MPVTTETNLKNHSVIIDDIAYREQPQGDEMARITKRLKQKLITQMPAKRVIELSGNGHTVIPTRLTVDENNRFIFESGSMFAIDVDDDHEQTNPQDVATRFNAVGLVYTFSHGIKGNRYRLFFQLERPEPSEAYFNAMLGVIRKELRAEGVPVDKTAINVPVRGGSNYWIHNEHATLNNDQLIQTAKQRSEEQQKQRSTLEPNQLSSQIPFEELRRMCEAIGHIPSGSGEGDKWSAVVYGIKSYEQEGYITPVEAEELHDIISGGETPYAALKTATKATIGSVIHYARESGYSPKILYFHNTTQPEKTYTESRINVDRDTQKLQPENAIDLLQKKNRILVDSPTGSGKTTSFIEAMKAKESENTSRHEGKFKQFYIFAVPTNALVDQVAYHHDVLKIQGQKDERLFRKFIEADRNHKRIIVATYDKIEWLASVIERNSAFNQFSIVVDEYHKLVFDLNYRNRAIKSMLEATRRARTFIALSGTTNDIDKNEFDEVVKVTGCNGSPNRDLVIYEYEKNKQSLAELATIVKNRSEHNRLLIFLQNMEQGELLKRLLKQEGVKSDIVNRHHKGKPIYQGISNEEQIPDEIDVLISTSVIADGVNLQNTNSHWEVITVCSNYSDFYNASMIKQISNRLRNLYDRFSLFIQKDEREPKQYNLEGAYHSALQRAKDLVDEFREDPFFNIALHRNSVIERYYGLYTKEDTLHYDPLTIRHFAVKSKDNFYKKYRNGFIKEVEEVFERNISGTFNVSELLRQDTDIATELAQLEQQVEDEAEDEKRLEELKSLSIDELFTKDVYSAFLNDDRKQVDEFKSVASQHHFAYVNATYDILPYQSIKRTISSITRKAEAKRLRKQVKALITLWHWKHYHRFNKTKEVFKELLAFSGVPLTNDDWDDVFQRIGDKYNFKKNEVKTVFKEFGMTNQKRSKKERFKVLLGGLTFERVAEENNLSHDELKQVIRTYATFYADRYEQLAIDK
ncbi:DEAD/DEAH box helicase, partial [Alkalibacillus flavidus]